MPLRVLGDCTPTVAFLCFQCENPESRGSDLDQLFVLSSEQLVNCFVTVQKCSSSMDTPRTIVVFFCACRPSRQPSGEPADKNASRQSP